MTESLTRSFFSQAYDRIGLLALCSGLRSLPWLPLALLLTFVSPEALRPGNYLKLAGGLALIAFLITPYLSGGVYYLSGGLARGVQPGLRAGLGRRYGILLLWNLLQLLLAAVIIHNLAIHLGTPAETRSHVMPLALGTGFWLWLLARLWSFHFLPLLIVRNEPLAATARLALLVILARPGRALGAFALRQLLLLLLILSGLGILLGLGAFPALHTALAIRIALRPMGLDLAPPGESQVNEPLPEGGGLRRIWRPWE